MDNNNIRYLGNNNNDTNKDDNISAKVIKRMSND